MRDLRHGRTGREPTARHRPGAPTSPATVPPAAREKPTGTAPRRNAVGRGSRCRRNGTLGTLRKRLGTRWASRTSNPVSGSRQAGGGFDSHTLPPRVRDGGMATQNRKKRDGTRHARRRWTVGAGIAAAVVVAVIV